MSKYTFACRYLHFNFPIFLPKSGCSPKKKKKGLHFDFISDFPIFLPKSGCSLKKKKRSSLRFHLRFPYFSPKIRMFYKKKKKNVFTLISSLISLFFSQKKVRKRIFEKYSRRRVPHKITSRAMIGTRAGGCRPLV